VLACYLLRHTARYQSAEIIRTHDPKTLNNCDILVDVGGMYSPQKNIYDHVMPGFKFRPFQSLQNASSLGLVYVHYGLEVITNITGLADYKELQILHERVYFDFLQAIDCIDNGVQKSEYGESFEDYTNWWMTVERFNLPWHSPADSQREQEGFLKAMKAVGERFSLALNYYVSRWLSWRFIVEKAYYTRKEFHPSGACMLLLESCGWKSHLADLQIWNKHENVLYCVHPHLGKWIVQFTLNERNPRSEKWLFPYEWRGLKDKEAEEKTQVKGVLYIHPKGYIAFVSDIDAAKALCDRLVAHLHL